MKLYNGKIVIPGLIVFVCAATFPLWYNNAMGRAASFQSPPNPEGKKCIESKDYMRRDHMRLLIEWRDDVVRRGDRTYTAADGKTYMKSLTRTCMECHGVVDAKGESTAATYCLDCHDYAGVDTYCWDCHIDPVAMKGE